MKKILLLFMCLCLLLSIVGCSNDVPSTSELDVTETDEDVDNTIVVHCQNWILKTNP